MKKTKTLQLSPNNKLKKIYSLSARIFIVFCILCSFASKKVHAQEFYKLEEIFMDAEAWFYFQDYKNSLPLYLRVHQAYPENDNINYKIGFCYLNLDGQKHKAIPYLEKAARNTTFRYSRESFWEDKAPVDAIFYLGNAYFINNQVDKALDTYNRFEEKVENKKSIFRTANFDYEYLQKQKEKCRNAMEFMSKPVNYTAENLGLPVNTPLSEYNPVVSGDGKTLIFTADKKFYTGIFMCKKKNGQWGPPTNLLPQLGIDGDCETTSLSYDGKELYLYREDELDGNIYVSYYNDGSWSNIKKLGPNINTKFWESHAYISSDNETLYFTSNREGGYGDLDIYKSKRNANGTWGAPVNIGAKINTEWQEDTPFLTEDENTLYFSSEGHNNMGGFDIFVSHRTSDGWTTPQNIGYPINTTDDDRFLVPTNEGKNAYYTKFNKKTSGQKDIFKYALTDLPTIDFIEVEGIMTYLSPENKIQKDFKIHVINRKTNDTIATLEPGKGPENYTYKTPSGENHLIYETPKLSNNEQYIISKDYNITEKFLEPELVAEEKPTEEKARPEINLDKDVFKAGSADESIKIKMQLKGGNRLVVNTFKEGQLVNTEEFKIDEDSFVYEYQATKGKSKLTFNLFDGNENILSKDVSVMLDSLALAKKEAKLDIQEKSVSMESGKKKIKIKLALERGSELFVETYVDDKLINKEKFNIQEETFTYEFEPKEERSKLNFKVIDQNNNVKNQEIIISHKPVEPDLEQLLRALDKMSVASLAAIASSMASQDVWVQDILDSLNAKVKNDELDSRELDLFLYAATILNAKGAEELYNDLYQLADPGIRRYMDSIAVKDLKHKEDLIALLKAGVEEGKYSEDELRSLLNRYIAQNYNAEELMALINKIAGFNLNEILSQLGEEALDLSTAEDLLKVIRQMEAGEKDQILAYLQSIRILDNQYKVELREAPKEREIAAKKEPKGQSIIKYVLTGLVGLILIIYILFLIKRRRNNSKS